MMQPIMSSFGEEKEGAKSKLLEHHRADAEEVTISARTRSSAEDVVLDEDEPPIRLIAISSETDPGCVLAPGAAVTPPGTPRLSMTEGGDSGHDADDEHVETTTGTHNDEVQRIGRSCPRPKRRRGGRHTRSRAGHVRVRSSSFSKVLPDLSSTHARSGSLATPSHVTVRSMSRRRHRHHPEIASPLVLGITGGRYYTRSHDVASMMGSDAVGPRRGAGIEGEGSLVRRLRVRRELLRKRKGHPLTHSLIGYVILAALWGVCAFIIVVFDLASMIVHRSHALHVIFNVLSFVFYATYLIVLSSTFAMTIYDGARLHDHILRHRSVSWEFWRSLFHAFRTGGAIFTGVAILGLLGKVLYLVLDWGILFYYFFIYNFLAVGVALVFEGVVVYGLASGKVDGVRLVRLGGLCSRYGGRSRRGAQITPSGLCGSFWCMFFCGVKNGVTETYMLMNNIPVRPGGRSVRNRDGMPQYVVDEQFLGDPGSNPVVATAAATGSGYSRLQEETTRTTTSFHQHRRKVVPPPIPIHLRNKRKSSDRSLALRRPPTEAKEEAQVTITVKSKKQRPKKGHGANKYNKLNVAEEGELVFCKEEPPTTAFHRFGSTKIMHALTAVTDPSMTELLASHGQVMMEEEFESRSEESEEEGITKGSNDVDCDSVRGVGRRSLFDQLGGAVAAGEDAKKQMGGVGVEEADLFPLE